MSVWQKLTTASSRNAAVKSWRALPPSIRFVHDGRNRLSNFWTPTQSKKADPSAEQDGHDLLMRAGYLRPSHAGIFHLLPLGLRVQNKIEALLDKHIGGGVLGASKCSLSSLSSQDLWEKSGRLAKGRENEFFKLHDRKQASFLLSPTHEEEITSIVADAVHSYKDLPLRLYQVTRKYRDEARPRQGLLRGREFVMKDLYTFDVSDETAMTTYEAVQSAYKAFFEELGLPYLVAKADSGNMGGNHSHEYHFASARGEDTIISCDTCSFSVNEEAFREGVTATSKLQDGSSSVEFHTLYARLKPNKADESKSCTDVTDAATTEIQAPERRVIVQLHLPGAASGDFELNQYAVKDILPNLDTSVPIQTSRPEGSLTDSADDIHIHDPRVPAGVLENPPDKIITAPTGLGKARQSDACPHCTSSSTPDSAAGRLHLTQAVEIGHTFHLGTRYSAPLQATVHDRTNKQIAVSMGCHGIGVTRLIGASAALLADAAGLNWPLAIAPFGVLLVPAKKHVTGAEVERLYDSLTTAFMNSAMDVVVDDRDLGVGWALNDADLIGYPFVVVLGKGWAKGEVEVQCRYLEVKENVKAADLATVLQGWSEIYYRKTRALA